MSSPRRQMFIRVALLSTLVVVTLVTLSWRGWPLYQQYKAIELQQVSFDEAHLNAQESIIALSTAIAHLQRDGAPLNRVDEVSTILTTLHEHQLLQSFDWDHSRLSWFTAMLQQLAERKQDLSEQRQQWSQLQTDLLARFAVQPGANPLTVRTALIKWMDVNDQLNLASVDPAWPQLSQRWARELRRLKNALASNEQEEATILLNRLNQQGLALPVLLVQQRRLQQQWLAFLDMQLQSLHHLNLQLSAAIRQHNKRTASALAEMEDQVKQGGLVMAVSVFLLLAWLLTLPFRVYRKFVKPLDAGVVIEAPSAEPIANTNEPATQVSESQVQEPDATSVSVAEDNSVAEQQLNRMAQHMRLLNDLAITYGFELPLETQRDKAYLVGLLSSGLPPALHVIVEEDLDRCRRQLNKWLNAPEKPLVLRYRRHIDKHDEHWQTMLEKDANQGEDGAVLSGIHRCVEEEVKRTNESKRYKQTYSKLKKTYQLLMQDNQSIVERNQQLYGQFDEFQNEIKQLQSQIKELKSRPPVVVQQKAPSVPAEPLDWTALAMREDDPEMAAMMLVGMPGWLEQGQKNLSIAIARKDISAAQQALDGLSWQAEWAGAGELRASCEAMQMALVDKDVDYRRPLQRLNQSCQKISRSLHHI